MTDAEIRTAIRTLIWDPPVWVLDERVGEGDGRRTSFELSGRPVVTETLSVCLDDGDVTEEIAFDAIHGLIAFDAPPDSGSVLFATYAWTQLSDAAIDSQLAAAGGVIDLAAARCLEVLALDPASVLQLRMEGLAADFHARRQIVADAIERLRTRGGYQRFQQRVDAADWSAAP